MNVRIWLLAIYAVHFSAALTAPLKNQDTLGEEPAGGWPALDTFRNVFKSRKEAQQAMAAKSKADLEASYVYVDGRAHCCKDDAQQHHPKTIEPLIRKRDVKAGVVVINLDRRLDRCQCMSAQLQSSPYAVERYSAKTVGATTVDQLRSKREKHGICAKSFKRGLDCGAHDCLGEMSLFCTQHQLWDSLVNRTEDYFIIMEDDVLLDKFAWDKIGEFLETYPEEFDLLQMDSYGNRAVPVRDVKHIFSGSYVYTPSENGDYFGGHGFIVKRKSLPKLSEYLERLGGVPVDRLPKLLSSLNDLNVIEAQLKVFQHPGDPKARLTTLKSGEIQGCVPEVEMSDLDFTRHSKFATSIHEEMHPDEKAEWQDVRKGGRLTAHVADAGPLHCGGQHVGEFLQADHGHVTKQLPTRVDPTLREARPLKDQMRQDLPDRPARMEEKPGGVTGGFQAPEVPAWLKIATVKKDLATAKADAEREEVPLKSLKTKDEHVSPNRPFPEPKARTEHVGPTTEEDLRWMKVQDAKTKDETEELEEEFPFQDAKKKEEVQDAKNSDQSQAGKPQMRL